MEARLVLGPAGSGKTFRCLAEVRGALHNAVDGAPLLLVAPRQTTYQLERQLLADNSLSGYTQLRILSFERLAGFVLKELGRPAPKRLSAEGRVMVLRALLARKRDGLRLFRASARLTGFARHLSEALAELQRQNLTPASLLELAARISDGASLRLKLEDFASLLGDYLDWLKARGLEDDEGLLPSAVRALRAPHPPLPVAGIWVDGFTELTPNEIDMLVELLPHAPQATITFTLAQPPSEKLRGPSNYSAVENAFVQCRQRLREVANCTIREEQLDRRTGRGRFAHSPPLRHLEAQWSEAWPQALATPAAELKCSIRATACPNREAEAIMAAREILRFVRRGGRYREVTLLARSLEPYHELLANIFHRYEIPFFLDRRESVSRHPLAELTRNALRTVASGWAHEDWFGALKTGLAPAQEADIDRLENEALARGWKGSAWQKPLTAPDLPEKDAGSLEKLRLRIVPPFNKLAMKMAQHRNQPTGPELADGINEFWTALGAADTLERWSSDEEDPRAIHLTVWDQMAVWLENVKLAFATERLPLRDWLPILDAGLSELTVGVIPPALDQVFIGAIDRSRNPDIRLAIVLGMNEGIFPAPPAASVLLTDADRQALDRQGVPVANNRQQAGRERFYAYVALTRAREQLVLSYSESDSQGKRLNPSAFLGQMKRLFPSLEVENFSPSIPWQESEHASELVAPLLESMAHPAPGNDPDLARLETLPELAPMMGKIRLLTAAPMEETLSPALAARLYTPVLRTSVSRMEQFAACPFKFFVHSGLRAEERKFFELDSREQGNYQHEVLEQFHRQVLKEGKRWRDVTPEQARERIGAIAAAHARDFHDGLLQATEKSRFTARMLTESLQDFVETIVEWLREQYEFDPAQVELRFGEEDANPAWRLELGEGRRIELRGRIDRVDLYRAEDRDEALCVVMDYKSGVKKLDALLMEHGIQLQLAAYLNVLRHWKDPRALFGVGKLVPAGVFYVSLRGQYKAGKSRSEALADAQTARKKAYRHTGRFDECALPQLDSRPDAVKGDQFNYSINRDGAVSKSSKEALPAAEFTGLLDHVEAVLTRMGQEIYAGTIRVDPFRKKNSTACEHCDYQAVCRIDPWTHTWRVLRAAPEPEEEPE